MEAPRDQTDVVVEFLCEANADIDPTVKALGMRIRRVAAHLEKALRRELAGYGVEAWEFEVLVSLYRADGNRLTAGALQRESGVTSGAITNRVARLEEQGWVERSMDPSDRRAVIVSLTKDGYDRVRSLMALKIQSDAAVFAELDADTKDRLTSDLRQLLISVEGPASSAETSPEALRLARAGAALRQQSAAR